MRPPLRGHQWVINPYEGPYFSGWYVRGEGRLTSQKSFGRFAPHAFVEAQFVASAAEKARDRTSIAMESMESIYH